MDIPEGKRQFKMSAKAKALVDQKTSQKLKEKPKPKAKKVIKTEDIKTEGDLSDENDKGGPDIEVE
jgi:hypothetical protein